MIEKVILGFGSNAGSRFQNIKKAVRLVYLSPEIDILKLSPVYETEPWGFKNQNYFLNCVVVCLSRLQPLELLVKLKKIELIVGRIRRDKWREREIDIDILFYGDRIIFKRGLIVPHPRLQRRNFVLRPLVDLIPGYIHPVLLSPVRYLYRHSPDDSKVSLYKRQLT
jgi:2-amino-4-hydroxy-6-hydroxymethyldihydropteridine diphosphokinase